MDRLLFGDNQFFGVNHMSEEKARAQLMRFQEIGAVMSVLDSAYDAGITTFMCTTHDRIAEVCDRVRAQPARYSDFKFFPCMPYAHKYADAMTESGPLGAVRRFLPDEGFLNAAVRGGRSLARKDIEGLVTLLIDAEMTMFRGLSTPVIWLQNVVVDLLLGLGFDDAFAIFAEHVRNRYQRRARLHHDESAGAAGCLGQGIDRESDRVFEHQQDRLPNVGRDRSVPTRPGRSAISRGGHVGLRVRCHSATRGAGMDLRAAEYRVGRLRRVEPGQYREHARSWSTNSPLALRRALCRFARYFPPPGPVGRRPSMIDVSRATISLR